VATPVRSNDVATIGSADAERERRAPDPTSRQGEPDRLVGGQRNCGCRRRNCHGTRVTDRLARLN